MHASIVRLSFATKCTVTSTHCNLFKAPRPVGTTPDSLFPARPRKLHTVHRESELTKDAVVDGSGKVNEGKTLKGGSEKRRDDSMR